MLENKYNRCGKEATKVLIVKKFDRETSIPYCEECYGKMIKNVMRRYGIEKGTKRKM